jgi:hypothetical protein
MRDLEIIANREPTVVSILLRTAIIILLTLTPLAASGAALRIQDPEKFCDEFFANVSGFKPEEMATKIATSVGRPNSVADLEKALKILDDKKIDYAKKVVDREFGGALRQIVYYVYVDGLDFLYFRFNFKMSSTGWILANFNFRNETNELFPKDFNER